MPPFAAHCQPLSSCSHCQPLLIFAALPLMVGGCVYARFVVRRVFRHPLPALTISCHFTSINTSLLDTAPFCCPLPATVLLLSLPAIAHLCQFPVVCWLLPPLTLVVLCPLLSLFACAMVDALVANSESKIHQTTSFRRTKPLHIAYVRHYCTWYW